jgi:tetratricopeptide (TPR) repeat protein
MQGQSRDDSVFTQIGTQVILPPVPAAPEVRYSLPPDAAAFTGRGGELSRVTAAVAGVAVAGGVVAVGAIDGMPGVGKTALAVRAAYVLRDKFPDRQLFIDLHAHTPGREPVQPEDALARLLAAVGVDPRFLPGDLDGRAALWRDKMAGQRALLVLDNAASTSQVAPLLPGEGGCLVLVTSRRYLGDLPGAVTLVLLDVLPPRQAEEMFTRLAPRAEASPAEVAEVVELAGFLPLAISLLARVFARHPSWTLADLATQTRQSLLTLTAEHDSIAAAFEVSFRHLDPARQRLFCLLGRHPGTTTDAYAAAALAGISLKEATGLLDGLHEEGLLTETGHRRYGMHDLLRRYARNHAAVTSSDDSQRALERLLDYYQHTAALAEDRLARQDRARSALAAPPATIPDLPDSMRALAWTRTERANLIACLNHVTGTGQHVRVIGLTAGLATLLRHDGPWADAITRHTTAAQAAQQLGDQLGQAGALNNLGAVRQLTGDYPEAAQALQKALSISRDLGDRLGQADALNNLGFTRRMTGDYPGAAQALQEALSISRDLSDRLGQADALNELGAVRWMTGDYPGAAQALQEALSISRDLGDRLGQADALNNLGAVRWLTGDYSGAAQAQHEALGTYRDLGDRRGQAKSLNHLGTVRRMTGEYRAAVQAHKEALGTYRDLGDRHGQASALNPLGAALRLIGDYPAAAQALEEALGISRDLGDRLGQSIALNNLGIVRRLTGDYPGAAQAHEEALGTYRDLGDRGGEVEVLNDLGALHLVRSDLDCAGAFHQQALELAREIGSSWDEAHALAGLARCALAADNRTDAEAGLHQALAIFQESGAAEAAHVSAELDALTQAGPANPGRNPPSLRDSTGCT